MKREINFINIVLLIIIAFLIFMYVSKCNDSKNLMNELSIASSYKDTAMLYHDRNGELITYNKAVKADLKSAYEAISGLKSTLHRLKIKKPTSVVKTRTETIIDTILVAIKDSIPCDSFSYSTAVDSPYYHFDLTLTDKNIVFNTIKIPNKQTIITGEKKTSLLKRREYVVTIENDNPYVHTNGVNSYTIKPKKRFYERWYFVFSVGLISGMIINRHARQ